MKKICVAGLVIDIESADNEFFDKRYEAYVCDNNLVADMSMKTAIMNEIFIPEGKTVQTIKSTHIIDLLDGNFCRYMKSLKTGKIPFAIYYNSDYSKIRIELKKDCNFQGLNNTDWEYLYTGFMFANKLTCLGGTVLHSSAMSYKHQGIVFSADPGTGKSTHVSLWKNKYKDDVTIINDDKPAIRFIEDGKPYIYGTPWSGKTDLNVNISEPLSAIVFIERDKNNSISRMNVSEAVLNLTRQLPNPFYDSEIGIKTVEFVKKIYERGIPVYKLKCNISNEAVETVYKRVITE